MSLPKQPLVVGGSGTLGRILIHELIKKGCRTIRVMDMVEPAVNEPQGKIEFFKHKLGSDPASGMQDALNGVDCVFSVLTPNLMTATKEEFEKGNVDGVKLLLKGVREAKVPRFVFTSSIAVTNHLIVSKDQKEEDPLPALDDYISWYDRTKRLGEAAVIKENGDGLATVAIRGGGLLNSHLDYNFKDTFATSPGKINALDCCAPIDQIDGHDFARALILAAEKLNQPNVAGEAFFVTKGCAAKKQDIDQILAKELGWGITVIPKAVQYIMMFVFWCIYMFKKTFGLRIPGCPMHVFLKMPGIGKTFDNRKAREVLGFTSEVTLEQSIKRIADEWRRSPAGIAYMQKIAKKN